MTLEQQFLSTAGRINRKIFILYIIAFTLLMVVLSIPLIFINLGEDNFVIEIISTIISILIELAMFPGIFLSIKRLHDLNKSAVYIVVYLIPFVNILLLLYLICFKGTNGENKYGQNLLNSEYENSFLSASALQNNKISYIEQKYFSTLGRLNRKPFIQYMLILAIFIIIGILGWNVLTLFLDDVLSLALLFAYFMFSIYLYLIFTIPLRFLIIRRLHDLNLSGWWIILAVILPLGYIIMSICLMFIKGSLIENRYGKSPLLNE